MGLTLSSILLSSEFERTARYCLAVFLTHFSYFSRYWRGGCMYLAISLFGTAGTESKWQVQGRSILEFSLSMAKRRRKKKKKRRTNKLGPNILPILQGSFQIHLQAKLILPPSSAAFPQVYFSTSLISFISVIFFHTPVLLPRAINLPRRQESSQSFFFPPPVTQHSLCHITNPSKQVQ